MLIEKIIEFEMRVPGPLVAHIFLKLVIFMTKQNSPMQTSTLRFGCVSQTGPGGGAKSHRRLRAKHLMLKMLQKAMHQYIASTDLG